MQTGWKRGGMQRGEVRRPEAGGTWVFLSQMARVAGTQWIEGKSVRKMTVE